MMFKTALFTVALAFAGTLADTSELNVEGQSKLSAQDQQGRQDLAIPVFHLPAAVEPGATKRQLIHEEVEEGEPTAEGEEHAGGEASEEEELDEALVATTLTAIVLVLILLTIVFEKAKHHIEHSADKNLLPIVESMFGEMTVLGFLSIFTFCVTKMGYFTQLSEYLFHEEEALLEEFEFAHYFLFFIMIFFVTLVLVLVHEAKSLEEAWFGMDRACLDRAYMEKLQTEYVAPSQANGGGRRKTTTLLSHFGKALFPFYLSKSSQKMKAIEDQLLFDRLRQEFILERSPKEPFLPAAPEHRVPDDFHFGRYLSICLGQTLAHSVHVGEITWSFFAIFTLVLYGILEFLDDRIYIFAWIWAGLGWLMFILSTCFDFHLLQILGFLAARGSASSNGSSAQGEEVSLLAGTAAPLPAWCSIDLDNYMTNKRSWLSHTINDHNNRIAITRQDTLYLLEHNGPKVYGIIFQIKLVFVSAYWSLLLLSFLPYAWQNEGPVEFTIYAIVSILPSLLVRIGSKHSASLLTKTCCIGVHSKPQAIAQVVREEKTARVVRAFCILQKLQQVAEEGFHGHVSTHGSNAPAFVEARNWDPLEVAQVTKTFHAFDSSQDGSIATNELRSLLERLGIRLTQENLDRMIDVLDINKDGEISQEEFVRFYMNHVSAGSDSHEHGGDHHQHELHGRAKFFFDLFDTDGGGTISISEFKTSMDAFEVGMTVDEVGELVSELDSHGDGTLSLHEFMKLFESHAKLVAMERSNRIL